MNISNTKILDYVIIRQKYYYFTKYLDFIVIFSRKLAIKFFKLFNINKYFIHLELGKQLSYKLIYSLGLIKSIFSRFILRLI